jgi:hypothetical protein
VAVLAYPQILENTFFLSFFFFFWGGGGGMRLSVHVRLLACHCGSKEIPPFAAHPCHVLPGEYQERTLQSSAP